MKGLDGGQADDVGSADESYGRQRGGDPDFERRPVAVNTAKCAEERHERQRPEQQRHDGVWQQDREQAVGDDEDRQATQDPDEQSSRRDAEPSRGFLDAANEVSRFADVELVTAQREGEAPGQHGRPAEAHRPTEELNLGLSDRAPPLDRASAEDQFSWTLPYEAFR